MRNLKTNRRIWLYLICHLVSWYLLLSMLPGSKQILRNIYHGIPFWNRALVLKTAVLFFPLLYLLTLGWSICADLNRLCYRYERLNGNPKRSHNFFWILLFSVLTCGIYYLFWAYQQGERLHDAGFYYYQEKVHCSGAKCLFLALLGYLTFGLLNFLFIATLLKHMNRLSFAYNASGRHHRTDEQIEHWENNQYGEHIVFSVEINDSFENEDSVNTTSKAAKTTAIQNS